MQEFENHKLENANFPFIFHNYHSRKKDTFGKNWHENIELLCVTEGTATILNNGETYTASKGDIALINKNVLHTVMAMPEVRYYCLIIDHSFCLENHIDVDNLNFLPLIKDEELFNLFKEFHNVLSSADNPFRHLELRHLLLSISLRICKFHSVKSLSPHEETHILYVIKQVIEYINSNFKNTLTLDEISNIFCLNSSYLSRSFHRITGYTVISYINHKRCEEAKKHLKDKEMKIEQIAALCGFENTSYFYRTFLKITGMRPGEYRMKHINSTT